jgi:hypothetical protein
VQEKLGSNVNLLGFIPVAALLEFYAFWRRNAQVTTASRPN